MTLISTTIPNLIGGVSQQPYTIRMASQCEVMENCLPSVVEFLRRRPATRHIGKIMNGHITDAAVHIIDRDSSEQYVAVLADNDIHVFDIEGNRKTVNFPEGKAYLTMDHPNVDAAFMTINDYTFLLNKTVKVGMLNTTTPTRVPEALVFIKQASYATDYHVVLDGVTFSHTTYKDDNRRASDGLEFTSANGYDMNNTAALDAQRYKLSSSVIAQDLANKINAHGAFTCHVVKSSLWILRKNNAAFSAQVSDSRSNTQLSITTDRVQRFSDLPVVAPNGYTTEITGDQSSSFDNYYVKFETNTGIWFDTGVWVETAKPGIKNSLNPATMPHALVREADGSFTLKTLTWGKRGCGDEEAAPDPSFIGRRLSAIFFYRNRLGLLASESCILSEAGEFFNFFPTTVTTLVDSDVIDVAASHTKAANLYHACAFSEGLILFSDQTQFLLEHDDSLSTKTVAVKPITEFECSVKAAPIGAGKNIFFATGRGAWAGVREYYVEEDSSLTDATDLTSHVPHYIPADIHKLVGSTNEDCLLALSTEDRHSVALYKYFWNNQDKLQSSWSKWMFTGEVLSAAFLNSSLLLVIQYNDGVYLEVMSLEPGYTDAHSPFEYTIDRKITEGDILSIEYDEPTKRSTLTFPYDLSGEPLVVSRYGPPANHALLHPPGVSHVVTSYSDNEAVVEGDMRGRVFLAGVKYNSRFRLSPQIIREESGNSGKLAVTEGRLQLRSMTFTYGDTGYFEVRVTPEYRETDIRVFTGRLLGHGGNVLGQPVVPSGTFRVPILSRAETTTIEIQSDSFLPFQITSAGWEGFYHIRSRRV